jgi:hypothetical protein
MGGAAFGRLAYQFVRAEPVATGWVSGARQVNYRRWRLMH